MKPRVSIVTADKVPALLEDLNRLRNPENAAGRTKYNRQQRAKARSGKGEKITIDLADPNAANNLMMLSVLTIGRKKPQPRKPGEGIITSQRRSIPSITDLNRDLNEKRVIEYADAMQRGQWILTADAIAITEDGLVINGQHRLAAAQIVATHAPETNPMPQFIVAWGIPRGAAHLMDEAQRSKADRRTIAMRSATIK